jgi:co-chaperonin GroES (HSP10)
VTKLKAVGEQLIVKRIDPPEQQTSGGLFIPQRAVETDSQHCEVLSVGNEVTIPVAEGDHILVHGSGEPGFRLRYYGEESYCIDQRLVSALIVNE